MGCAASTGPLYRDEHDFATTAAYYDKDEDVKKDWVENEQLGEGMFARVVKVTRKSTNQQYACKVLRKTTVIEDNEIKLAPKASDLLREIDCLRRVGGAKGCLKLCGVVESPSELRLVMELCAGSLLDYVHDLDQFDERFAALYASQLLEAVAYHLVRLGERVHLPDVGRRRLPGVRLAVQRRFGRRRPLGPRPRRGPQLGRRDRHRAGRPRRGARGARLRLVVAAPKVPHVHPHLHRSAIDFHSPTARPRIDQGLTQSRRELLRTSHRGCQSARHHRSAQTENKPKTTAIMRIILLACATTHALIAPQRRQPAKTIRYVKVDTDNFFFKALDGAKELAFRAGDLLEDAGDVAKDAMDRAKEARAPKPPADAAAAKVPVKKAPFDLASAFNKAPAALKVAAPPAAPVAKKKAPFDFGGLASAVQAKKPSAKQAPFDFKAANEASKARVDAAFASLDAATDALQAAPEAAAETAASFLKALQGAAAAVAKAPDQAKEALDATTAAVEATAESIAALPDNVKSTADSVGSAVTGTVDAVASIPENVKNTADSVSSTVKSTADAVASIPETVKSTAEAVAAVPEKIGNAVDSAVATAEAVAAVPGKIADGVAGFSAWLQSVLPKGPPQLRPPPDQLRSAQPAPKKKWGRPMELPKEEPVAAPPKASPTAAPVIDVEAYVPAATSETEWAEMETKERSAKKPAPTSYLDGL